MGKRRSTPSFAESLPLSGDGKPYFIDDSSRTVVHDGAFEIVEGRPARNRGVTGLFEDAFHKVGDRGLPTESDQNMTIAEHCCNSGKRDANALASMLRIV